MSDEHRIPQDPAGTQPKVEASSLLPARVEREPAPAADPDRDLLAGLPDRVAHGAPAVGAAPAEAPHAAKFQFLLGALIALGIVAVASIFLIGSSSSEEGSARWSPWKPTADGAEGAQQIGDHVGPQYRLPTGEQLVLVAGGDMEVQDLPLDVALRDDEGDVSLVEGDAVLYRLCGLGPKCAISKGKPSQERHLLLRRESLELALYSFHYLKGVDQVVVQLPPPKGQEPNQALFFRKGDVAGQLATPLRATLPLPAPSVKTVTKVRDAPLVNRITTRGLFSFSYSQAQDARVYLVLEPPGATISAQPAPGGSGGSGSGSAPAAPKSDPAPKKPS